MVYYDPAQHSSAEGGQRTGVASGIGGITYIGPHQLDKKYYTVGNAAQLQYGRAAQQILQGAEGADAEMLKAYRSMYLSRLGGAAARQGQETRGYAAEAAGQGMSDDLVRRLLANRRAEQSQVLSGYKDETEAEYAMQRAGLIQNTGNSIANLLIDETKFGKGYGLSRRGAGGAGGILGSAIGPAISSLGNFASSATSSSGSNAAT